MGRKGKKSSDESIRFAPTKAVLQQMEYSAKRSGTSVPPPTLARADKWDWNAGKLSDAKWYVSLKGLVQILNCIRVGRDCANTVHCISKKGGVFHKSQKAIYAGGRIFYRDFL
jgi:hypothetical protein